MDLSGGHQICMPWAEYQPALEIPDGNMIYNPTHTPQEIIMASKHRVTRNYQLGGHSTFGVNTVNGLLRTINSDRKAQADGGDCQGIGYTMSQASAEALGLYEVTGGGWVIPGTEILVDVS